MGVAIFVPGVSFADNNLGKVTLKEDVPVTGIRIEGPTEVNNIDNEAQYIVNYTPSNTSQRGVTWSITNGNEYAKIDQNGKLTALGSGVVTISAVSLHNPSINAEIEVNVYDLYGAMYGWRNLRIDSFFNTEKNLLDGKNKTVIFDFQDAEYDTKHGALLYNVVSSVFNGIKIGFDDSTPKYNYYRKQDGNYLQDSDVLAIIMSNDSVIIKRVTDVEGPRDSVTYTREDTTSTNPGILLCFGGESETLHPARFLINKFLVFDGVLSDEEIKKIAKS